MNALQTLVTKFVADMSAIVEEQERICVRSVLAALEGGRPYSPPAHVGQILRGEVKPKVTSGERKARRKGPIQLCPIPKCANRAAPVFGMVCSKHKDVPKALVKKYREARRAKKG